MTVDFLGYGIGFSMGTGGLLSWSGGRVEGLSDELLIPHQQHVRITEALTQPIYGSFESIKTGDLGFCTSG